MCSWTASRGTQANPFNSFAQLPATTGNLNATIYLKRGTTIHQELDFNLASNFVVDAYGSGAAPIIDASNVGEHESFGF